MLITQFIILVVLILFSAFFSGIETALISLNIAKVKALVKRRKKGSKALYRIKKNPHRLIITILIGNNLVNIGAASFATIVFTELFGSRGLGIATGVMTFLILVFGEITPKTYASQNATRISLFVARPVEILSFILFPLIWFFTLIAKMMSYLLGSKKEAQLSEAELKTIFTMGREEGILDKEAAEMMNNIIEFEKTHVREIMTPKHEVDMIDGTKTLKQALNFIVRTPYSKYPVYVGSKNQIVGVVDVDDVLRYVTNKRYGVKIRDIAEKPYFVRETKEIDNLLAEFEHRHSPLAVVKNKEGKVVGIVTIEDILEEIVGEIFDKSKRGKAYVKKVKDKSIVVDARASIREVNKIHHLGIRSKYFSTIAGFVENKLKKTPKKGDKIKLRKVIIEVARVVDKKVKSVNIIRR